MSSALVLADAIAACLALANFWLALALYRARQDARAKDREHDRRIDSLLDRLAHAQGRTWMPPPADTGDDEQPVIAGYDPFQEPD